MREVIVALSGGIGAGKAELGKALAEAIGGDRASFGDEVRRHAAEAGIVYGDMAALQRIGQSLVLTQPAELVRRVLGQRRRSGVPLVVEGLRHVEILLHLREQAAGKPLVLLHVDAPRERRTARVMAREKVDRRTAARLDADVSEVQATRILPQYADAVIDGGLPLPLQLSQAISRLRHFGRPGDARA